jgi:hypothetical protein
MQAVRSRSQFIGRVCVSVVGVRAQVRAFGHFKAQGIARFENERVDLPVERLYLSTSGCDESVDVEVMKHFSIEQMVRRVSKTRGLEAHYFEDRTLRQISCHDL